MIRFQRLLLLCSCATILAASAAFAQNASGTGKPAAQNATASATPSSAAQAEPASAPQPAQNASATSVSTSVRGAKALTLEQQIAKLPPLTGVKIDAKAQGDAILQHLNDILRFYRTATTKIQKAGEPSDILYSEQSKAQATQIAQLAFESARNEAALLNRMSPPQNGTAATQSNAAAQSEAQRIAAARTRIQNQVAALQATDAANTEALSHANAKTRPALLERQQQIAGEFKFLEATLDALNRVASITEAEETVGLGGEIDRLASSAPELTSGTGKSITAPPLENVGDAQHAGLVTQGSVLFDLLSARRSIEQQVVETDRLRDEANNLREPFINVLRSLINQGEALSQQTATASTTGTANATDTTRSQFDQLTSTFEVMSNAMLPLSQEVTALEEERGTLTSWSIAIDTEYKSILRSLLIRAAFIAGALLLLAIASTLWSRATVKYVQDVRRRRQLLIVRRIVIGFLGGLIVIFGFVTQFSSLATFAGFISAGIAVGLQTILLSVAAYFFIIGRYGVRVGDRITVAGVTGTVIEVGLARFYMMELVGSGTELHSTGRVAVFANSVLFQTGTPLYKQLPGTEYAWHELVAKLKPEADPDAVTKALVAIVESVYQGYREAIEGQQHQIESWMGTALDTPRVDARLRMADDGLQVIVLFPVEIDGAAKADEAIATRLVQEMRADGPLKSGLAATPVITAAIKI